MVQGFWWHHTQKRTPKRVLFCALIGLESDFVRGVNVNYCKYLVVMPKMSYLYDKVFTDKRAYENSVAGIG